MLLLSISISGHRGSHNMCCIFSSKDENRGLTRRVHMTNVEMIEMKQMTMTISYSLCKLLYYVLNMRSVSHTLVTSLFRRRPTRQSGCHVVSHRRQIAAFLFLGMQTRSKRAPRARTTTPESGESLSAPSSSSSLSRSKVETNHFLCPNVLSAIEKESWIFRTVLPEGSIHELADLYEG